ncbi:hypothetical protein [Methanobrevibacter sp.]|uniref:hypothetical protein n=1 Tax=Methanobrevibacter sp. TaxID=66852 RepID=UPI00388DE953
MKDEIFDFISGQFDIDAKVTFEFHESCGFTFVFKKSFFTYHGKHSSAEIKPVAIIYEEKGEFYLAPLDEITKIDAIVKEFVENCMK